MDQRFRVSDAVYQRLKAILANYDVIAVTDQATAC